MSEPMDEEVAVEYKQESITPFWQKLPFFFLFPFRLGPMIFMFCIIAASALAGLALGGIGMALKGFLVYLGLRYAFNVLELFSQGRFEGESVDHTLWGPEKRPAKLGLVIALYIVIGVTLGNALVTSRIAGNPGVQDQLLALYKKDHAAEQAQREREMEAFNKRIGLSTGTSTVTGNNSGTADDTRAPGQEPDRSTSSTDNRDDADSDEPQQYSNGATSDNEPAALPLDTGPSRAEILAQYRPTASDPLWFKLQPGWFWMFMLVLSLMLPAAAIVIALEDKFFKALNPAHVIFLTKSMGSAYFALWALFLLIAGARQFAMSAGEHWPMALRFPVEMGLAAYLALVLFAMMGYALYQFHQELSLDVAVDFDSHRKAGGAEAIAQAGSAKAAIRAVESKDPLERKVQALLAEGKVKEAIAEVKDVMRYDRFDPALNSRLHPLYVAQGEREVTLAHGQQWLTAMARANDDKGAFDALRALLAIDPEFAVQDGDAILPAARGAVQKREHAIALNLIRGFDKRFPKHKDMPGVFFLGAKLSSEHLRQQEKAVKILRMLLTHFPEDAISAEARIYLTVLEKSIPQGAASA